MIPIYRRAILFLEDGRAYRSNCKVLPTRAARAQPGTLAEGWPRVANRRRLLGKPMALERQMA
jgi:hypothetical protein